MKLEQIKNKYSAEIVDHMLDVLFDTPVSDLVLDVLESMPLKQLDKWAIEIEDEQHELYSERACND
jgi:hypothetical protein